jgi:hypothetical protein
LGSILAHVVAAANAVQAVAVDPLAAVHAIKLSVRLKDCPQLNWMFPTVKAWLPGPNPKSSFDFTVTEPTQTKILPDI